MKTEYLLCTRCKRNLPTDCFYRANNRARGYQPYCKDCSRNRRADYAKTEQGKANQKRYDSSDKRKVVLNRSQEKHRVKRVAVSAVNHLVRTGKIPRANTQKCKLCGKQAREYHHHKGYSGQYKLDVIPICRACHVKEHEGN